jgi:NAD(P)-dependent dehydrogenase (short-subunit alcohol dehydrogenase family)
MKTAVITGGTRGIGAGLVRDFLKLGWNVSYSGTSDSSVGKSLSLLSANFRTGSFRAFKCDVTEEKDVINLWDNTIKAFGQVDIWVNNAGTANEQLPFHKLPSEIFMKIIDTNIKGLMLATQIAYNRMAGQGFGAIYNMEGLGSDGRTISGLLPYGTSKRAVRYFTDGFAGEVMDGPVIIGTISPGMVLTDLLIEPLRKNPPNKKQMIRIYNILANDVDTVTPFLVRKMTENRKNGAKIAWLTSGKVLMKFLMAPFSKRDVEIGRASCRERVSRSV